MANRYATSTFVYWDTTSSQHETVHLGALRDSASHSVTQKAALFKTTPLVAGPDVTGVLAQYLLTYPTGP
jgi:hypothetical protein